MASPREHIEKIRRIKFSIGREMNSSRKELNPLEDLHQSVVIFSAELYTKDIHFLLELIQNAEDNEYPEGVDASLEFIITSKDITGNGAPATLVIFNNEKGFSPKNIESICSVGRSTKKGNRKRGYIGEKGIGFKSVFLITSQPYIFSNGYHIRFNEEPCTHCGVGYIVPEWVEESSILSNINQIYGSSSSLPTTVMVLPLKPDKVKPVKQQLSVIHPEVLLFLSKIKQLSVKEVNGDPKSNTVSAIAISSETNFVTRKNMNAESYTLHLSAEENGHGSDRQCGYYMWKQKFPVREENKVERRMGVEEWVITLAFPNGERLHRGKSSPGIYAFLPTEMVTNFPFIIQADFILASSRETILLDSKWNQGILDCVPDAFVNAFTSLVKNTGAHSSCLPRMFKFLPVITCSLYENVNVVREKIKAKLIEEDIVPSETFSEQKFFHKPREVGRIMPAFWNILGKARGQGVSLINLSSHGRYILSSSFDDEEYDEILNFLEVEPVDNEWYARCIQSTNLVVGVSDDVYMQILLFIADNWSSRFSSTNIKNIPLIKYVGLDGTISLCSINESVCRNTGNAVHLSRHSHYMSWLIDWNKEFGSVSSCSFMPQSTQKAVLLSSRKDTLLEWLKNKVKVDAIDVSQFAHILNDSCDGDRKSAITYVHFLYHSLLKKYLTEREVDDLCRVMPLVEKYGNIIRERKGVLYPADGSNWAQLLVSNPWRDVGFIELGEAYLHQGHFAGEFTGRRKLISFLKAHVGASDIPCISPPNSVIPTVSAPLTKQNAFLLLDWIHNMRSREVSIPERFLKCIKEGSWLRVTVNGCLGYRPPSQSFQRTSSWGSILQTGSALVDIPLIDQTFYGDNINQYKEELRTIGVMSEYGEACQFIGKHLMSLAIFSTLTRGNVLSILSFIRFLRDKLLSPDEFIHSIKEVRWLRTRCGDRTPVGSVLYDEGWRTVSQICDIPFIDQDYYGEEILGFKNELQLLGVVVGFNRNHQLVIDYLKSPSSLTHLRPEAILLILECIHYSKSSDELAKTFQNVKCLKTSNGYKTPTECYLFDPEWGSILQVFSCFPLIDCDYYSPRILSYRSELKKIGVVVDFDEAVKAFAKVFKQQASSSSISTENVMSFLSCCRQLNGTAHKFPKDLKKCILEMTWLRTRLGDYRSPKDCILFGPSWESITQITLLPFVDDNYYGKRIHTYEKELKRMGVVTGFKDGVHIVASSLCLPQDPNRISSANVLSLLESIRILLEKNYSFSEAFEKKISKKWLKTNVGYRSPEECLLFDDKWASLLKQADGPFIDESFYAFKITSYRKELNAIGVTVDVEKGCSLMAKCLDSQFESSSIVRIYSYLNEYKWKPKNEDVERIWIPDRYEHGEWVNPEDCVLYDKDELFGSQLIVLERYYEQDLLLFFSTAFNVKSSPSVDCYCKLWKIWEDSGEQISEANCLKFWTYVLRHFNSKTEKAFTDSIVKIPVKSGSDEILLYDKNDVFIADDLYLKDLFEKSSPQPVFVWYPQSSSPSLPRTKLLEIYGKIGVSTISMSVLKEEVSATDDFGVKQMNPNDTLIAKGLIKLILGFLADPKLKMESERRHETVRSLVNISVFETEKPIVINYSLSLSSGKLIVNASASRMIRWERENAKLFTQKMESGGQKDTIEYATYFSYVISNGILWENSDQICSLSDLIRLAFVMQFNEEAVDFLMKSKNLQIFKEDEDFLSSAFP